MRSGSWAGGLTGKDLSSDILLVDAILPFTISFWVDGYRKLERPVAIILCVAKPADTPFSSSISAESACFSTTGDFMN
jgi:hypothetical protein